MTNTTQLDAYLQTLQANPHIAADLPNEENTNHGADNRIDLHDR